MSTKFTLKGSLFSPSLLLQYMRNLPEVNAGEPPRHFTIIISKSKSGAEEADSLLFWNNTPRAARFKNFPFCYKGVRPRGKR